MRVLQILDTLSIGGAQKLMIPFAKQAQKEGVDLTIISLRETHNGMALAEPLRALGAKVYVFPAPKIFTRSRMRKLIRFLREGEYSVIHTHLTSANILGGVIGKITGTPVISSLHSTAVDPKLAYFLRDNLELLILRFAKKVIGVGQSVVDAYQPKLGREVICLPNAVNENEGLSAEERAALRTQIGLDSAQPTLITVGRLSHDKAVDDLLRAFALILQQVPDAALLVVGDGVERPALESIAKDLQLGRQVFWLGMRDDVPQLLSVSDIYISASRREGLPLSLLEAMMASLPMVVTDVGEVAALVADDAGILVPHSDPARLAEAALRVLALPDLGKTLGEAGLARAKEHYAVERWFARQMDIYAEVMSKKREQVNVRA